MKQIKDILASCEPIKVIGDDNMYVSGIALDSRLLKEGFAFVAVKGTETDGHLYIAKSIENGAKCIICQDLPESLVDGICYVQMQNTQASLFNIAASFYDNPASKLKIIGITGTNGKTTTASILYQLFNKAGRKAALISTVAYYIDDEEIKASHTTPDAITLNSLFSRMLSCGVEYCFMEVSSHALSQNRVAGIDFKGAVFCNITHDHLDYHQTFSNYLNAKKTLFDNLSKTAFALVNADDKNAQIMLQNTRANKYSFALKSYADYKCKIIEKHIDSTLLSIGNNEFWVRFAGHYNALNITAAYAVAILEGIEQTTVLTILSTLQPVSGRFETVKIKGITGIVDYAHTPDALKNILDAINELKPNDVRLITVVGAGGNRDKTKRPIMASIAVKNSDKLVLTSDNPRNESPEQILEDMRKGVEDSEKQKVLTIVDRREAIRTACMIAQEGDIVLVAGKGHETYQEIKGIRYDFDDKQILLEQE